MHTISVIYRKPGDPQKYITFCQMPGDDFNEYFTKIVGRKMPPFRVS